MPGYFSQDLVDVSHVNLFAHFSQIYIRNRVGGADGGSGARIRRDGGMGVGQWAVCGCEGSWQRGLRDPPDGGLGCGAACCRSVPLFVPERTSTCSSITALCFAQWDLVSRPHLEFSFAISEPLRVVSPGFSHDSSETDTKVNCCPWFITIYKTNQFWYIEKNLKSKAENLYILF